MLRTLKKKKEKNRKERKKEILYGTTGWFKTEKGVRQGYVYCHHAYLTSMQSTS